MSRHNAWKILILVFLTACGGAVECNDKGECSEMQHEQPKRLVASQTSNMRRTTAVGSRTAPALPVVMNPGVNLQINNLEPGEYTLQFQALPPGDNNGSFGAYAIVNWKVRGQQIQRKVSVFSGAALSGVAEAVDVTIVDVSNIGFSGFPASEYKVAGLLSKGSRAVTMQPATLITNPRVVALAAGTATQFAVPENAGVISALVTVSVPAALAIQATAFDFTAEAIDSSGNVVSSWNPSQTIGFVPLFPNTVSVSVFYKGAVAGLANVVWGIEG